MSEIVPEPVPTLPAEGEVRLNVGVTPDRKSVMLEVVVPARNVKVRMFYGPQECAELAMALVRYGKEIDSKPRLALLGKGNATRIEHP